MVHSHRLPPHRKAQEGADQEKTVFSKGVQEAKIITVAPADATATEHTLPDGTVCADVTTGVTKDDQFVRLR
nr:unnamed protein product [Spirometra erinaceieuropaei]